MTTYTHTAEQHAQLLTIQKQLIDLGEEKTAALLDWAVTAEPAGWRPIETAETVANDDGFPHILGHGGGSSIEDCTFVMYHYASSWREAFSEAVVEPTHWMPLPQSPAA